MTTKDYEMRPFQERSTMLLRFEGVPRSELEARIRAMAPVYLAAAALVVADDAARDATEDDEGATDERYERAWDELRSALSSIIR